MNTFIQANNSYETRVEKYDGKEYLVVPVIMMMEGVHSGSAGSMLYLAEELGKYPDVWNGIPVVVTHPEKDGQNISANSPAVLNSEIVGRVFNTVIDGEKVKSEIWLNEARLAEISPEALDSIKNQKPLDVSAGIFNDVENLPGTYRNEQYSTVARNLRPDHLALLPGERGACSWADGCGIRANSSSNNKKKGVNDEPMKQEDLIKTAKSLSKEGYSVVSLINDNEQGWRETISSIQSKLDGMDDGSKTHYLSEVYDNTFIYEVRRQENGTNLYKRNYQIDNTGVVSFGEEVTEVARKTEYVIMKRSGLTRTKFSNNNSKKGGEMSEVKTTPCCEDVVDELIANKRTTYSDTDKEWLMALGEENLGKLVANIAKEPEVKVSEPKKEPVKKVEPVANEAPKTTDEYIDTLPEELQDQVRSGLQLHKAARERMVTAVLTTHKDVWTKANLEAMGTEELSRVYKTVPDVVDYSLNSPAKAPVNNDEVEPLYPGGVEVGATK